MVTGLCGHSDSEILTKINDMIGQRSPGRYHWDLSRSCCGHRGILPFLRVLEKDTVCESLDASGCGLDNSSVEALALALRHHPVRLALSSKIFRVIKMGTGIESCSSVCIASMSWDLEQGQV
jgi:hypothetical protein